MKIFKKLIKIGLFSILLFLILYGGIYLYARLTPKLEIASANSFYLYDKNDNVYGSDKEWIALNQISEDLINATVATEDKNFYHHQGFDFLRILKAMYVNVISGEKQQGASTISQQYAKNLFLDFGKTWSRKIEEAWLTIRLESHYSKEEILEGYLNTINYGGVFGIENAAQYYFDKSARDLTLAEASMLAGIPKSPDYYSPLQNAEAAKNRQKLILKAMVKNGYITEQQMEEAYQTELVYQPETERERTSTILYYQDAVIQELHSIKTIPTSFLKTGGLKIYTNFDSEAQKSMEEAMKKNVTAENIQLATVAMDPNTGQVLGLIGGRDYTLSQYNRAVNAKRAVGSTIKPFLYYAALENGFTPSTTFTSEKTTFTFSEDQTYSPHNYANIYANKPITMAAAIAYSDNIYAVKTHLFLGEETLVNMAKRVGIETELSPVPSLALGSQDINLLELTGAYATFANEGYKVKPYFIRRVEDINGNVLYENNPVKENVLNKSIVYLLNEMLSLTYDKEMLDYNTPTCFAISPKMSHKYAVKTGTTDTDVLVFGYTPNYIVGVWTGYDDNQPLVNADSLAVKNVWIDSMEGYLKDKEVGWYPIPKNVVGVLMDPIEGKLATNETKHKKMFYYIKGTEPSYNHNMEESIPTMKEE